MAGGDLRQGVESVEVAEPIFRVLGGMGIGMSQQPVSAPKTRQVLALLLVNAGHVVSTDEVIDELWPEGPPPSAAVTVQTYIGQARRALRASAPDLGDPKHVVITRSRGYCLDIDANTVDAVQFFADARRARDCVRAQDYDGATCRVSAALGLWRGQAFSDVPLGPRLRTEVVRMDSERLVATELAIELDLRAGRHHDVISDLSKLVMENPGHERFSAQLIVALYRSGRRADALTVFRRTQQALRTDLGLDPSPVLSQLHLAVLHGDAKLDRMSGSIQYPA